MNGEERQRPRAFRLDDERIVVADGETPAPDNLRQDKLRKGGVVVETTPDAFAPGDETNEPRDDEEATETAALKRADFLRARHFWSLAGT